MCDQTNPDLRKRMILEMADAVNSRTSPTVTMRRPPAALLHASRNLKSGSSPKRARRSSSASSMPTVMSLSTVEGPCAAATIRGGSRVTARSLV